MVPDENQEVKVVYLEKRKDGTEFERAIRGIILREDRDFITIQREDGEFRISKKVITRIEKPTKGSGVEFDGEAYK